jgi:hypothetical protein
MARRRRLSLDHFGDFGNAAGNSAAAAACAAYDSAATVRFLAFDNWTLSLVAMPVDASYPALILPADCY